jgi:hypothetical protein
MKGYIIGPIKNSVSDIEKVALRLKTLGAKEVSFWNKDQRVYKNEWLDTANFIVIYSSVNSFEVRVTDPMLAELKRASDRQIPVFLAYRRLGEKDFDFYETDYKKIQLLFDKSGSMKVVREVQSQKDELNPLLISLLYC